MTDQGRTGYKPVHSTDGNNNTVRPNHREIIERIIVTGTLKLETPAQFGNGDSDAYTDMPLLVDEETGRPLLPGTSLAGALRNYLRERQQGFEACYPCRPVIDKGDTTEQAQKKEQSYLKQLAEERDLYAVKLFGAHRQDSEGAQSPLIVYDALGNPANIEFRDGVSIDAATRTAKEDKKFDMQLLAAGSTFGLRFELLICAPESPTRVELFSALATALDGLAKGELSLGARKRRGLGKCSVADWQVWQYRMDRTDDLLAWLISERPRPEDWHAPVQPVQSRNIIEALSGGISILEDHRQQLNMIATFALDGSLMIRAGFGEADQGPDVSHIRSTRPGQNRPQAITPGTSWAGILRARAGRIVRTLGADDATAHQFVNNLFGPEEIKTGMEARASRLIVSETQVDGGALLVQNRIKIDRFTGGAYEAALFEEQPLFGSDARIRLELSVLNPTHAETGLVLLLLKDLWTGDLPIGGESSIGRGRLRGISAQMTQMGNTWQFDLPDSKRPDELCLSGTDMNTLQSYIDALGKEVIHDAREH
jgi:CRISPR/Cas system CSM-associated protein Csm3 (group 7 of RAMP superfamily)